MITTGVRSPFAYYGGKTRLASDIAELFPPHLHYVEPFAGSLAVLLAKTPVKMETVNDRSERLMTFWRVLRDRSAELARKCELTPHGRAEYDRCVTDPIDPADEVETARRVWVLLSQGRSSGLRKTGWRHFVDPAGSGTGMPGYLTGYVDRMAAVAARLRHVSLECGDAFDLIDRYGQYPEVLLYVDPPYVRSARSSRGYEHELTDADHEHLAGLLRVAKATVVLSGYDCPLYDDLYGDWYRTDIRTHTSQGHHRAPRVESLWANRPLRVREPDLFEPARGVAIGT